MSFRRCRVPLRFRGAGVRRVDRRSGAVLRLGHQVRVGPQREAGLVMAEVIGHGADRHSPVQQHRGEVVAQRVESVLPGGVDQMLFLSLIPLDEDTPRLGVPLYPGQAAYLAECLIKALEIIKGREASAPGED